MFVFLLYLFVLVFVVVVVGDERQQFAFAVAFAFLSRQARAQTVSRSEELSSQQNRQQIKTRNMRKEETKLMKLRKD